jgi:hypothetical protein
LPLVTSSPNAPPLPLQMLRKREKRKLQKTRLTSTPLLPLAPLPPPLLLPLLLLPLPQQPSVQLFFLLLPYSTPLISDPMRSSTRRALVRAPWAISCFMCSCAPSTPWVGCLTLALNMLIVVTLITSHWLLHLNEWSWVGSVSPMMKIPSLTTCCATSHKSR